MPAPSPNFSFLGYHDPRLVVLGTQAERLFAEDPSASLGKLRLFGEILAQRAAARLGLLTSQGDAQVDPLGLEKIYIQAKRWARERKVGRPEIQAFFGALAGQRATKGLFMTTARFTPDAEQYAGNVSGSLILVDGRRLVSLMIEYGVGVTVASTLKVPKVDYDYFEG